MEKERKRIIFFLSIGIIGIFLQISTFILYNETSDIILVISLTICLIVILTFIVFNIKETQRLYLIHVDHNKLKSYNETLVTLYDNLRLFKHDYGNFVQTLIGYVQLEDLKGLKRYLHKLLPEYIETINLESLNPELVNEPAIYSLLCFKYQKAKEKEIMVNMKFFIDFTNTNIRVYETCKILGILLDNAIESAQDCAKKEINIIMEKEKNGEKINIMIENTYIDKQIDINRIFEKEYSTKKNINKKEHGIGLWEVNKIIKKCREMNLRTDKNQEYFKQHLEINLLSKKQKYFSVK